MTWLKSLHVENFRSIAGDVDVSLDAPIVLIHGPNGAGKTSLLSAIELALTGDVPSLSRAEPGYHAYLPHRGREFGRVRLDVADPDGTLRTGDVKVTAGGVTGKPILGAADAAFFSERSYLAQSTLGRLLEIYQHAERKAQSPLTRFVKELLGLDRMEALINGLGTAGHISRLKGPVPAYGKVREDIPLQEKALGDIDREAQDAAANLAALQALLRERMSQVGAQLIETPLVENPAGLRELGRSLALDVEEAALTDLVRARREVEVSEAAWKQASAAPGTAEREMLEAEGQRARVAFDAWARRDGDPVEGLLGRRRDPVRGLRPCGGERLRRARPIVRRTGRGRPETRRRRAGRTRSGPETPGRHHAGASGGAHAHRSSRPPGQRGSRNERGLCQGALRTRRPHSRRHLSRLRPGFRGH